MASLVLPGRWSSWLLLCSVALAWNCSGEADDWSDGDDWADYGGGPADGSLIDIRPQGGGGAGASTQLSKLCGGGECIPDDGQGCEGGGPSAWGGEGGLGDLGPQGNGCQLVVTCEGTDCAISRECSASGRGERGAPCFASSDCAAGLACVGDTATGSCQPYCCQGTQASCGSSDFCGARPLVGGSGKLVPVCLPTENCPLTEPFPCAPGQTCTCSGERACMVVRSDGQTACAVPGEGRQGAPCTGDTPGECAHGFVCSSAAGCLRLCSPLDPEMGCDEGESCQTPADFPGDLGVCVTDAGGDAVAK